VTDHFIAEGRESSPDLAAPISVVQVNTHDDAGGAARVARDLHEGLLRVGERSRMAVGRKRLADDAVRLIDNDKHRNAWSRLWLAAESAFRQAPISFKGKGRLTPMLVDVALPGRALAVRRGVDYFGYPATRHVGDWAAAAELLHLHNLHGEYFDLRALPELSARFTTVLTLHDAWLLAGHCGHSFECERWRTGCGNCPDLSIPPPIRRDGTAQNWRLKRDVFAASTLYVAAPSKWLMDKAETSILARAIGDARVIPNGVDLDVFRPQDKLTARADLHLPTGAHIIVFAAHGGRTNPWKDFSTIESAAMQACGVLQGDVILVVIGGRSGSENAGNLRLRYVPHLADRRTLAKYLAAADVCVHAARVENFSLSLCESLACGTPVVSVRSGGTGEIVKNGVTGVLVAPEDAASLARALARLLQEADLRESMGKAAAAHAASCFGRDRMVDDYRRWYHEIRAARRANSHHSRAGVTGTERSSC